MASRNVCGMKKLGRSSTNEQMAAEMPRKWPVKSMTWVKEPVRRLQSEKLEMKWMNAMSERSENDTKWSEWNWIGWIDWNWAELNCMNQCTKESMIEPSMEWNLMNEKIQGLPIQRISEWVRQSNHKMNEWTNETQWNEMQWHETKRNETKKDTWNKSNQWSEYRTDMDRHER